MRLGPSKRTPLAKGYFKSPKIKFAIKNFNFNQKILNEKILLLMYQNYGVCPVGHLQLVSCPQSK